jgi:hypothetical protein
MSFCIADIGISVTLNRPISRVRLNPALQTFRCNTIPTLSIKALYDGVPSHLLRPDNLLFDSQGTWSLYRTEEHHVIVLKYGVLKPTNPYEPDVSIVDGLLMDPLDFIMGEVLMMCLLAQRGGLLLHACGIKDGERGYLFTGHSTHGKSTIARLWKEQATVLNDERIVLRWRDGRFWIFGTPWNGEYHELSPEGVPLGKVLFLQHAKSNRLSRVEGGAKASTMLLARSFPPLWDAEAMRSALDFCAQLVESVPCYELGFVPDSRVLDLVRCVE